jgi:hypothetical protein
MSKVLHRWALRKKIKSGQAATKGVVGSIQSVAWDQRYYDPIEGSGD